MKTDDLIAVLAADIRPVDTGRLMRATWLAAVLALAATATVVLLTLGARAHLPTVLLTPPVLAKILFGGSVAGLALAAYQRSLRPGRRAAGRLWLVVLPFLAVLIWALAVLAQQPAGDWAAMALGRSWRACLIAVPLYALLPLAALIALARRGASVNRPLTGAAAGLASAGLATMAYSLHCPEDAIPFVASWYPLGMLISGAIGAAVAPPLTQW